MIKITFEFPTIDAAVAFLQKGKLTNTNETVGVLETLKTDVSQAMMPEDVKAALEKLVQKTDDPPVHKRKSRVGKKSGSPPKRGSKKSGEPKATRKTKYRSKVEPVSDEITDADLAKAASIAAEAITPAKVMATLEQFGVGDVSQLKGEDRREFLDLLDEEIDAEKNA